MLPLPVDEHISTIADRLRQDRAVVVVAPPGSGKTTRIPPALTALGRTILLQPRRIAARTLARRIADEQGWNLGQEVGWHIRLERNFSPSTRLLVATEGILTARMQSDPLLSDFSVVILDEFHERSIHADLALAMARQALFARDDLYLVVMSATIDAAPVATFIGASVIDIVSRAFPIDIRYRPASSVSAAILDAERDARGDILCFLPGAREIDDATAALSGKTQSMVVPLHGSLDVDRQERALAPAGKRKIILSTNIAETSLTVEGVSDVIDAGLQKVLRFNTGTSVDHLMTERIPTDSADQRAGRAGRTGPGRAFRLWDERDILNTNREPEIRRIDLAPALLDIIAWGGQPEQFDWFERPPSERVESGMRLLRALGAIDGTSLTITGEAMRRLPLHPRLGRVLLEARGAELAAQICAALGEGGRGQRRALDPPTTSSDAFALAQNARRDVVRELMRVVRSALGTEARSEVSESDLCRAILCGYPDRVAMRRGERSAQLLLASGTGVTIGRESGVRDGEFLVALEVTGDQVRSASVVERRWLAPTRREVVHFIADERVRAVERLWYGAILLREQPATIDPEEAAGLVAGLLLTRLDPLLLSRIEFAQLNVDWKAILDSASLGRTSAVSIDVLSFVPFEIKRRLQESAPLTLTLPSGRDTRLDYRTDGSVVASAKLQELFGLAESPRLGPLRVPVTFALLSPAGRPVQITQDLRSFWSTTYAEVRKELRGRYPKHPWPDDPWNAPATHRAKRRAK